MAYAPGDVMEEHTAANPAVLAVSAGVPLAVVVFVAIVLFAPLVALAMALIVWFAVSLAVWRLAGRFVLRIAAGHAPDLREPGAARLENLLGSVSAAAGVPKPALVIVDDPAPDALVTGRTPREATLVATSGLVEHLDRLQLEAVVAHQLALLRTGAVHARDVATVVLGIPGVRFAPFMNAARRAIPSGGPRALELDAAAVGVTRYPPALLGALEIAAAGPTVGGHAALDLLWWMPADRSDLDLRLDHMREAA